MFDGVADNQRVLNMKPLTRAVTLLAISFFSSATRGEVPLHSKKELKVDATYTVLGEAGKFILLRGIATIGETPNPLQKYL